MSFKLPDREELKQIATELGRPHDDAAAETLLGYMQPFELGFQYLENEPAGQKRSARTAMAETTVGRNMRAVAGPCSADFPGPRNLDSG